MPDWREKIPDHYDQSMNIGASETVNQTSMPNVYKINVYWKVYCFSMNSQSLLDTACYFTHPCYHEHRKGLSNLEMNVTDSVSYICFFSSP